MLCCLRESVEGQGLSCSNNNSLRGFLSRLKSMEGVYCYVPPSFNLFLMCLYKQRLYENRTVISEDVFCLGEYNGFRFREALKSDYIRKIRNKITKSVLE